MRIKPFKRIIFNSIAMRHFLIVASLLFLTSSLLVAAPGEETSEPGKLEASTEVSNFETGSGTAAPVPPAQFPTKSPDEWRFHLLPLYVWAMGISGEGTIGERSEPIQADFGDLFDNLEFIFTVHFEAGKGRWGGFFDYSYTSLNSDVKQLPLSTVNVDLVMKLVEGGGTFQLGKGFEALAGVRYVSTDIDTRIGQGPQLNMNQNWADPIFGIRYISDQSKRFSFIGRADLGGYSTSNSSDFTWNLAALLDVKLKRWLSLVGGYRATSFDYKTKVTPGPGITPGADFKFDVIMQGPIFALGFHF